MTLDQQIDEVQSLMGADVSGDELMALLEEQEAQQAALQGEPAPARTDARI